MSRVPGLQLGKFITERVVIVDGGGKSDDVPTEDIQLKAVTATAGGAGTMRRLVAPGPDEDLAPRYG